MNNQISIILYRPQQVVNIGATVRVMKNMGLRQLRLVDPIPFEAEQITRLAHRSEDLIEHISIFPDLASAMADTTFVVGTTARHHSGPHIPQTPRGMATEILQQAQTGHAAILFGPEDAGLRNMELDHCHALIQIPTDPGYASLNLAQAVLIIAYELYLAAQDQPPRRSERIAAPAEQLERLFQTIEAALASIQFFKTPNSTPQMRILRNLIQRSTPDEKEANLLLAIFREIQHAMRRKEE